MHIAVFLQYYHTPDCPTAARPYALVERLARDHEVTVITTQTWEEKRVAHEYPWAPHDAEMIRFDVPYDNSMSALRRLGAFLSYAVRAVISGLTMRKPDLIIGSSTPLTAAMAAAIVAKVRGIPWIFEVRDLWPDFPIQMGVIPWSSAQKALYALERSLYRSAAHVVTLSEDMERHVKTITSGSEVTTIEYGADVQLLSHAVNERRGKLQNDYSLDREFLIVYAGAFGRANAIPTLLSTARRFRERSDVLFAFAGRGVYDSKIEAAAERFPHIRRLPPLPYPDALALFSLADVSLVPFIDKPVLAANSPGKLFDSLAAGSPIIVTNPGWTKRLVEETQCGWYVSPESPNALAERIRTLLGHPESLNRIKENAHRVARRRYDRAAHMDRYAGLVRHIAETSKSVAP